MAYTFARRDQLARQQGWTSYGHKRAAQIEARALRLNPEAEDRFLQVAKEFKAPGRRRTQMRLWILGVKALIAKDHATADAIGAQLPVPIRTEPTVPESVFWYHT